MIRRTQFGKQRMDAPLAEFRVGTRRQHRRAPTLLQFGIRALDRIAEALLAQDHLQLVEFPLS